MPQEPKKRHSRGRQGKRRASIHLQSPVGVLCANCGTVILSHAVCTTCGFYKGISVIKAKTRSAGSAGSLQASSGQEVPNEK